MSGSRGGRKAALSLLTSKLTATGMRTGARLQAAVSAAARGTRRATSAALPVAGGRGGKALRELSPAAAARVHEIFALAMVGLGLFLFLACVSYRGDGGADNLCGPAGEAVARGLLETFGYASYLLLLCLGWWAVMLFARLPTESLAVRGSGVLLVLVSSSALIAHAAGDAEGRFPPGGTVGFFLDGILAPAFGPWGTPLLLVLLTLMSFVLATDIHYFAQLSRAASWTRARAAQRFRRADAPAAEEDDEPVVVRAAPPDLEVDTEPKPPRKRAPKARPEETPAPVVQRTGPPKLPVVAEDEEEEALPEPVEPPAQRAARLRQLSLLPAPELNPEGDVAVGGSREPSPYVFPSEGLLEEQESVDQAELDQVLGEKTALLEKTLSSFKVDGRVVEIQKGPVISMFEMELAPGIKVEKVRSLEDDLAIALRARTVRIVAPIPGKNTIGIEIPNPMRETVRLKPLLRCPEYVDGKFALPIFLGRDAAGRPMIVDLAKMPHLLVAGATGSGKSVCLNTVIVSLLFTRSPEQVKLVLIDPKMVELSQFGPAPHLACPVVSDMKRAPGILDWAVTKMEERYRLLSQAGVRNIYSYNKLEPPDLRERFGETVDQPDFPRSLPFIVIVIDELADLMLTAAKEVEGSITRLAAKSRAVGIHLIVATQRPSTNVITGLIKANLPTRIAFMVSSKIDSRVILDENGAEQLLGQGDMLFMPPHSSQLVRGQCTFLSEDEVRAVMGTVKTTSGPAYEPELVQRKSESARDPDVEDDLYDAATRFVLESQRGSASLLQRKFAIGYTRASRLIDMMAEEGVLGDYKGSQAREIIMTLEDWIARKPEARTSVSDEDLTTSAG